MSESRLGAGGCTQRCSCRHEYQDEVYGKNIRIHTIKKDWKGYVCTVCGSEKK